MANASLSGIYERLNNTSSYHPFSASTFNDWSMEAGDVVTVKSGDKSYSSPVFNNKVSWKGSAESTLNTSGNQTRDSISKVSQQKYSSSASGITNGQGLYGDVWGYNGLHSQINQTESNIYAYVEDIYQGLKSGIDITSSSLRLYVDNKYAQMTSGIDMTASSIKLYVDNRYNQMKSGIDMTESSIKLYVDSKYNQLKSGIDLTESSIKLYVDNKYNQMKSGIDLTESSIKLYVDSKYNQLKSGIDLTESSIKLYVDNKYTQMSAGISVTDSSIRSYVRDRYNNLRSGIEQTASSFALYIAGVSDSTGKVTAASIAAAINAQEGTSTIKISADKINVGASGANVSLSSVLNVLSSGDVTITGDVYSTGTFHPNGISMAAGSTLSFAFGSSPPATYTFNSTTVPNMIVNASVANDTLTLTKMNGDEITFRKAIALTGTWSSGTYTVGSHSITPTIELDGQGQASFSAVLKDYQDGAQTTGATGVSKYIYLVESGSGRTAIVKACANSDGTGSVGQVSVGHLYTEGLSDGGSAGYEEGLDDVTIVKGTWSGGIVQFTKSAGAASTKTVQLAASSASWSSNTATIQIWDGTAADSQHGVNTGYTVTVDATNIRRLGTQDVTISDTISWTTTPSSSITAGTNSLQMSTSGRVNSSGTASEVTKTLSLYTQQTTWSSNKCYVYVTHTSSTADGNRILRKEVDASGIFGDGETAGKNAVTIVKGSWNQGVIQFSKSEGTTNNKTVQLTASSATWDGNVATVQIWDGTAADSQHGSNTGYTVTVDASNKVNTAVSNVSLSGPTWTYTDNNITTNNTATVSISNGGTPKAIALYLAQDSSFSNNKKKVYMRQNSAGGTTRAEIEVDATSVRWLGTRDVSVSSDLTFTTAPSQSIQASTNSIRMSTSGRKNSSGEASEVGNTANLYTTGPVWDGNTAYVYVTCNGTGTGDRIMRKSVDASDKIDIAVAAVTVSGPTWSHTGTPYQTSNTATFTASNSASAGVSLYMTQGGFSSNKKNVSVRQGSVSGTIVAQVEVDATSVRYAGRADVTLDDPTWSTGVSAYPTNNTVTISTDGRTNSSGTAAELTKSVSLYLTQGTFSSHKKYVVMRVGSSSGTVRARLQVDATTEYDNGYDKGYTKGLEAYYNSSYWSNNTTTGEVKIPNKTNTAAVTWFTYNVNGGGSGTTTHSPTVTNWGEMSKSSPDSAISNFLSGRTRAHAMLQSGYYYIFQAKCGSNTKSYFIET